MLKRNKIEYYAFFLKKSFRRKTEIRKMKSNIMLPLQKYLKKKIEIRDN